MTYQILMIEDDEQICEVVKDYFTRESENEIVVRTAQNGQDGLDLFETERVDLVLLDIMLPGMDGFAICREMRRTSMVPILFLTARSSERDILLGYDLGCDDYIIKPFICEMQGTDQTIKGYQQNRRTGLRQDTYEAVGVQGSCGFSGN